MNCDKNRMSRRRFIGSGVTGVAAAALLPSVDSNAAHEFRPEGGEAELICRPLGRTGVELPVISLGSRQDLSLYNQILDVGPSLVFTAQMYENGNHEKKLGELLKKRNRDSFMIATAIGVNESRDGFVRLKDAGKLPALLEESLARLQMDYVDVFFLSFADNRDVILNDDIVASLERMKTEGKARFIGIATHENEAEAVRAAADGEVYDIALAQYNFRHPQREEIKEAFAYAAAKGLGTLAMKAHAGRFWDKERKEAINTKAALKWAIRDENLNSVLYRVNTIEELQDCLSIMESPKLTTDEIDDLKLGDDLGYNGLFCPQCGKCRSECVAELDIPTLMRCYMYAYGYEQPSFAKESMASVDRSSVACTDCTECIVRCEMGFNVRERVLDIIRLKDVPDEFLVT